jgi:DNA-binding MarR family transcriptional regulator
MGAARKLLFGRRRLQEVETVLNDTWYSRDLPVLTAIAEKLERGSDVDTEQLIEELGLTRQDLTAALRALDVEYLIVRWPERITFRRSAPSIVVERITSSAREAVGLWPSTEARQTAPRRPGHDQE